MTAKLFQSAFSNSAGSTNYVDSQSMMHQQWETIVPKTATNPEGRFLSLALDARTMSRVTMAMSQRYRSFPLTKVLKQ